MEWGVGDFYLSPFTCYLLPCAFYLIKDQGSSCKCCKLCIKFFHQVRGFIYRFWLKIVGNSRRKKLPSDTKSQNLKFWWIRGMGIAKQFPRNPRFSERGGGVPGSLQQCQGSSRITGGCSSVRPRVTLRATPRAKSRRHARMRLKFSLHLPVGSRKRNFRLT